MYNSFYNARQFKYPNNRISGGFAVPFLLGGLTGGLLAPTFYPRPNYYVPRPYPYQNYYPYPIYY